MARRIRIFPFICFFIVVSMLVGFVYLVLSSVFGDSVAKFHVVNASLTQFNLTTTTNDENKLAYNLTLDVKLRNPSKTIGIRYRRIRAAATYKSRRFALITLPPFYQGHKNTTVLHPLLFQGETLVEFKNSALKGFSKDQRLGSFRIAIEFHLDLTFKLGGFKFRGRPLILCDMLLPLGSYKGSSTAVGGFKTLKCSRQHASY